MRVRRIVIAAVFIFLFCLGGVSFTQELRFEISFSASAHQEPITGRVFVMISRTDRREPRLQAGSWRNSVPFFGVDVNALKPGNMVIIDENVLGYPPKSLREIPDGDYYIQALVNIYTQLHLSCGDMDNYYLAEVVYELEAFLEDTKTPYYEGSFTYGRPRKPHGWSPFGRGTGNLERVMAEHIAKNAPAGEDTERWKY